MRDEHRNDRRAEIAARDQQLVAHEREQRARRHPERRERRRQRNDADQVDREAHVVEHLAAALLDDLGDIAERVDRRHDVADDRHRTGNRLHVLERDVVAADLAQPRVEAIAALRDILRRDIAEPGNGLFLFSARWELLSHVLLSNRDSLYSLFSTDAAPPSQDFSGPPNPLVGSFMPPAADATAVPPWPAIPATSGNAPFNAPVAAFAAGAASAASPP